MKSPEPRPAKSRLHRAASVSPRFVFSGLCGGILALLLAYALEAGLGLISSPAAGFVMILGTPLFAIFIWRFLAARSSRVSVMRINSSAQAPDHSENAVAVAGRNCTEGTIVAETSDPLCVKGSSDDQIAQVPTGSLQGDDRVERPIPPTRTGLITRIVWSVACSLYLALFAGLLVYALEVIVGHRNFPTPGLAGVLLWPLFAIGHWRFSAAKEMKLSVTGVETSVVASDEPESVFPITTETTGMKEKGTTITIVGLVFLIASWSILAGAHKSVGPTSTLWLMCFIGLILGSLSPLIGGYYLVKGKGYNGLWALIALVIYFGPIILLCLPDRTRYGATITPVRAVTIERIGILTVLFCSVIMLISAKLFLGETTGSVLSGLYSSALNFGYAGTLLGGYYMMKGKGRNTIFALVSFIIGIGPIVLFCVPDKYSQKASRSH